MRAVHAMKMTPNQAIAVAQRVGYEPNDSSFSVLCALADDGGTTLSTAELRQAFDALTAEHGGVNGCMCALAGEVCDLNALRTYVHTRIEKEA